ncbi:hypothetical protein ADIARSV_0313 [Arcticibacter svalbardensis MN12-7]|uniref:Uncharacterized protein n=1 Tax=Arcticibacter svalbardensis MN12-7 TaxID=1150600 RepID=R9H5T6_9SPHI|nr:hypothetical protein ADIARSV_0313 [Arcticibacter svalbardensis MN12-7]
MAYYTQLITNQPIIIKAKNRYFKADQYKNNPLSEITKMDGLLYSIN